MDGSSVGGPYFMVLKDYFPAEIQESKPIVILSYSFFLFLRFSAYPCFHASIMFIVRALREVGVLTPRRVGTWMEAP